MANDQHTDLIGRISAQLILERISGSAPAQPAVRYVEPSIVLRGSSGPPPGGRTAARQVTRQSRGPQVAASRRR